MKAREIFMYVLGGLIVIGIFALLGMLIFVAMPEQNKDLLNIVIGTLVAAFVSVVGYFYGSSKGSADKTDMLKNGKQNGENSI